MKLIRVNKLGDFKSCPNLAEISAGLDKLSPRYAINVINWKEFAYKPEVDFIMAYTNKEILIKYYVKEDFVKAEKSRDNEMVCEDSCVEFFIAPAPEGLYYNFEFNSIGTCYLGSGQGREDSAPMDKNIVKEVRRYSSLGQLPFGERKGEIEWELTVAIPIKLIFGASADNIRGKKVRANFYKCGDKLSEPHYLTWNEVLTKNPDYHRPEYFGEIIFD